MVVAVFVIVVVVVFLVRVLFPTKVCSRCEQVSLHPSGFELALQRDALMAPFWGRHGCMSLYIIVLVLFAFAILVRA